VSYGKPFIDALGLISGKRPASFGGSGKKPNPARTKHIGPRRSAAARRGPANALLQGI
jgi:hypothetical protein